MRSELTGADAFLRAVEQRMLAEGQGFHYGLSVVRLGSGFDRDRLLSAVRRVEAVSHIAGGRVRQMFFSVPCWEWSSRESVSFPVEFHASGEVAGVAAARLNGDGAFGVRFDIFPQPTGETVLMVSWRHLLLDGKGAELLLAELARLSADWEAEPMRNSWGPVFRKRWGWKEALRQAEQFKDHFYANAALGIASLAGAKPCVGAARHCVERFSPEEVERIRLRARGLTKDLFFLPYLMGVGMRAHQAIWQSRGWEPESYQASCAVQLRKHGASGPIWQNQVSQLFFCVPSGQLESLEAVVLSLQEQFTRLSKSRMERAFVLMTDLFRRFPVSWYLKFIRSHSSGQLTSFFYSYTGKFMAGVSEMAGAKVMDGWHAPSVPAPPGTGLFFSECNGALSATFSWREGVVSCSEMELMVGRLRFELLGE